MKKVYLILIIIILLVFSLNLSLDAQKKKIIDRIVVAIDHNYPPYIFRSEEGFLKGYLVDLWREWEKVTGVQVVLYAVEWSQALKSIEEGKSDVIDTIFYTEERAKIFSYSKPYATINVPIIYSKTISGIADYDSLKGFLIAAKEGDAAVEYLQKNGVTNLILFKDYKDIILSAKDEKIKVFTIDEPCAIYYLNKYNILENYKIGFYLYTGQFHRAVKKGNEPLLEFVENGFDAIPERTYKMLENKWFGVQFKKQIPTKIILISIVIILLIIIIFVISSLTLNKLVKKRTSELRKANQEIETERNFLESLFKIIPDIIIAFDNNLNVVRSFFPQRFETYKEILKEEFLKLISEELKKSVALQLEDILSLKNEVNMDSQVVSFDIRFISSKNNLFLLLAQDITDKINIEKNMYEKQKLEIIGTLASGLAHDMNNVLHSTLSISSLIKLMLDEDDISKENLNEYSQILERSALKGTSIVSTLLNFSKDNSGIKTNFDLKKTNENSIEIFNMKYKKKLSVQFLTELNEAVLYGTENQIMQVIINLLINSFESYERKGEIENTIVKINLKKSNYFYIIDIEDYGEGIKSEIEDKIFNPFFTTKVQGRGIGVGLTIAKKIIEEHGGQIKFKSIPNIKTTFSIYLPSNENILEPQNNFEILNKKDIENSTIFIVDDDINVLEVTKKNLQKRGFHVLSSENIAKAKEIFFQNKDKIKCCIFDLVMPEMNGIELLKYFSSNGYNGFSIISTGYKDDPRLNNNKDIKIDFVIEKPYNFDFLYEVLVNLLFRNN